MDLDRAANGPYTHPIMRFWWVNQNQTFEQEFHGGFLWSPKRRADGARNQFYENMREVTPGDIIFSFKNREIAALGVAQSHGYDRPKPTEFGSIGENWEKQGAGWRDSDNDERLDGANGLLLTPSVDHLFDRGFISFKDNGDLLVSPVGDFRRNQRTFLEFHRDAVFLQASRPRP